METIEILIILSLADALINQLRDISPLLKINLIPARKADEIPDAVWEKVEVLYTNRVLPLPEKAPRLTWIQFHWAGIDHALDAPILRREGLVATSLSGASAPQMAEHVLMMLLALGHHLPEAIQYQKRSEWPADRWGQFSPQELRGSTVGIVGYGSVGRQVARLLQAFDVTVLATKRDAMHPEDTGYIMPGLGDPPGDLVHRLYPPQALISMLKLCDFVVVSVPLAQSTHSILGAEELAALKPTAYLVDASRGGIVDHSALIPLLREHKIAGAALDVFPTEPLPADSPLWKMPNVLITPHIAGFSPAYDERAVALFAENLQRYLANLPLFNRLNLDWGY
ncbi:MAG: D-2-hydroxyacid dehydrogenase [Anaerolineales bacterium]|nr:D-2-hydroxyacid dehydrogenase [Anaerolineales bacterium]